MMLNKETKEFQMTAKTFHGLEEVLALELKKIGAKKITKAKRAVYFSGDKSILYKSNLYLRTALKVLKPIYSFTAKSEHELYKKVKKVSWSSNPNSVFVSFSHHIPLGPEWSSRVITSTSLNTKVKAVSIAAPPLCAE